MNCWTKIPPTKSGWYYWRYNTKSKGVPRYVADFDDRLTSQTDGGWVSLPYLQGEWGGKVPSPDEHQQAIELISRYVTETPAGNQPHKERHQELHRQLDELLADFIAHTSRPLGKTTVLELLDWSYEQSQNPSPTPMISGWK